MAQGLFHYRIVMVAEHASEDGPLLTGLRAAGIGFSLSYVEGEKEFVTALATATDVIICSDSMPRLGAIRALRLLQEFGHHVPLIVVAHADGVEAAVEAMRLGASDYLPLSRIDRLPEAIRSAVSASEAGVRARADDAAIALRACAVERCGDAIVIVGDDGSGFTVSYANAAFERVTGLCCHEITGRNLDAVLRTGLDPLGYDGLCRALREKTGTLIPVRHARSDGQTAWNEIHLSPLGVVGSTNYYVAVVTDVTRARQYQDLLERAANYDVLTGLPNRNLLRDRVEQAITQARRSGRMLGLISVNLDRFKFISDSFGHAVGDQLLRRIAQTLTALVTPDDTLGRSGEDQFFVILSNLQDEHALADLLEKLRRELAQPLAADDSALVVTASLGASLYPRDGQDAESLRRNANLAAQRAASYGGNQWRFFTRNLNLQLREQIEVQSELHGAVSRREFRLLYQPVVDLQSDRVVGAETLLRWAHPKRGLILPGAFVHLAERAGLIPVIGEWVLHTACAQLQRWNEIGCGDMRVSVNVSIQQLYPPDFAHMIADILRRHALDPSRLEIEISERISAADHPEAMVMIDDLKQLGLQLALDNFGTGTTSISTLNRLPLDRVKIDRALTSGLPENGDDLAIISSIIHVGTQLGFRMVAQGVERKEQLELLRSIGCQEAQGYLLGRPMDATQFAARLAAVLA